MNEWNEWMNEVKWNAMKWNEWNEMKWNVWMNEWNEMKWMNE